VDADRKELNIAYAFDGVDIAKYGGYRLAEMKEVFSKWDSAFAYKGWLSIFLSNHDQARLVSRWGNDSPLFRNASTKLLNTFILSMRGTPYCYYVDELGMTNIDFTKIEQYKDIAAINGYKKAMNNGEDMEMFMQKLNFESRDNGRTPMQWNTLPNSGFTSGKPWISVNDNYVDINVEKQKLDKNSVLNHFRTLAKLRKENPILVYGAYELIAADHHTIYAYTRTLGKDKVIVLLNFSTSTNSIELPSQDVSKVNILINNMSTLNIEGQKINMLPYQAIIIK
nr:alpha-amylase family glycosyl hydrolase [Saprospiraceae bacterium]